MVSSKKLFLTDIKAFMKKHKLTATKFGIQFAKSPTFVFDLKKGRAPTLDVVDAVDKKMKEFEEGKE